MATSASIPRIGVAAVIRNQKGELLFGKRLSSHGRGTWQFPGGHLDFGETYFACAERETLEETGLKVKAVKLVGVTNDIFEDAGKHYVTLFVVCLMDDFDAKPEVVEPDKCEGWYWKRWEEVREWCSHHDDTGIEWADKKCFLPIKHLAEEQPHIDFNI